MASVSWLTVRSRGYFGLGLVRQLETSDHSAVFIDIGHFGFGLACQLEPWIIVQLFIHVVLEQPIPHCKQEVYLKNSGIWELVRGDVQGLNSKGVTRFHCLVSSLNEAPLHGREFRSARL